MSEQYPGGFVTRTPPTPDGSTGRGLWTLSQAAGYAKQGLWPTSPGAPTIGTATAGVLSASITFTAPSNIGSSAITTYTATSSPGGFTGTSATSPVTVSGLTAGTSYTFTVTATNGAGTGPSSAASNSVAPTAANYVEQVFSTWLYSGNGTSQTINNGIDLSTNGGLVWCKIRNTTDAHALFDTARGFPNWLVSNTTGAQNAFGTPNAADMVATSTGFSMNNISSASNSWNSSGNNFVSWTFREQPKFFDIVTYTGNGVNGRLVSHNLGSTPGCVIIKSSSNTENWGMFHRGDGTGNAWTGLSLNLTGAGSQGTPQSTVTSTNVGVTDIWGVSNTPNGFNTNGVSYVMYVFAHNAGGFGLSGNDNVISCGSYVGTGAPLTVTLGYEPQWVMTKVASGNTEGWSIFDNMRGMPITGTVPYLFANATNAENLTSNFQARATSTGFIVDASTSNEGNTYIYVAIRRGPMKVPTLGTRVFTPIAATNTTGTARTVGFPSEFVLAKARDQVSGFAIQDRLRGALTPNAPGTTVATVLASSTAAETSSTGIVYDVNNTQAYDGTYLAANPSIFYHLGRAPSFFDEVCYTGTAANRTVTHNLTVVPELIIVKRRSAVGAWEAYSAALANTQYMVVNTTAAAATGATRWNSTSPTSSVFSLGTSTTVNASAGTYVAYLFASASGVSKVGSYTGTGTTLQVNCGFTSGSRFVLIKRTDSTGDWYIWDSARGIIAGNDPYLLLNSTAAEVINTDYVDTYSAGFEISSTAPVAINASGGTYIFLAIA